METGKHSPAFTLRCKRRTAGTALLEWIVAAALGVFLMSVLVRLYQVTMSGYYFSEARFEALATAAATERLLHKLLHHTAGWPCGHTPHQVNLVNSGESTYWLDVFRRPLQIHAYDSAAAASIRPLGTAAGERAAYSDVIVAMNLSLPVAVNAHIPNQGKLELAESLSLERGEFVMICDYKVSVLVQVTDTASGGRHIFYTGAAVIPGNCASRIDPLHGCVPQTSYQFGPGAVAAAFEPVVLFVGRAQSSSGNALYREQLTLVPAAAYVRASMRRKALIEDVDLLLVQRLPGYDALDVGIVIAPQNAPVVPAHSTHLLGARVDTYLTTSGHYHLSHEFTIAR